MWMNEYEIDETISRTDPHTVVGRYARFLGEFRDEVNANSDGWPYWRLPANAADRLMTLLNNAVRRGILETPAEFRKSLTPIKAFYTHKGYAAGMKLPCLKSGEPGGRCKECNDSHPCEACK